MKKKFVLLVFMLTLVFNVALVVDAADFEPRLSTDYSATLSTWGWDKNYWDTMTKAFNKIYPNIKFDYTPVANGDYLQKVQISIATGAPLPDILWGIWDARARLFNLGVTEPLNKPPYNFDIDKVFDEYHKLMVDKDGNVMGIEQGLNPSALAYNKKLAKKYLGTVDRKKLEAMLQDWNTFIKLGKKVRKESNEKVYMMAGIGDVREILAFQNDKAWVKGGAINAYLFKPLFKNLVKFRDSGILDKLEPWTPAWYAAYGQDKYVFAPCAIWSPQYVIEPNDPRKGNWGIMKVIGGYYNNGGTTYSISSKSSEKEAAWEFVRFATLSREGAEAAKKVGNLVPAKKIYKDNSDFASFTQRNFGNVDLGKFWIEEAIPQMKIRPMTIYDNKIYDAVELVTTSLNNDMNMTSDEAMQHFVSELKDQLPDLDIKLDK